MRYNVLSARICFNFSNIKYNLESLNSMKAMSEKNDRIAENGVVLMCRMANVLRVFRVKVDARSSISKWNVFSNVLKYAGR